uniref:Uncharacterized protein AlNc14C23G2339 n=1 Tax=Albugo laibachii Nc14 TaxID=890382 RepID=F0W637_9STRA|nr:conserved hypothetical protein [Albugo laibachii Nc14]|eukprot:CCA16579.1 conserved hypothetical protein [Albugo laibachii Nc14]
MILCTITLACLLVVFSCVKWTPCGSSVVAHNEDEYIEFRRNLQESPVKVTPFSSWSGTIDSFQYIGAFLLVLIAAHPVGLLMPRYVKLPLITGYLLVGILAGPFSTDLITTKCVAKLSDTISALALSFISFQAGQEIYYPELKPQLRGILLLLATMYLVIMVIMTSVLIIGSGPFFHGEFHSTCQLAIALLFGSIAVLGSPATAMAIKIELNSVGPFTNLMLGATMLAEFIVLISFSVSRILSSTSCLELSITFVNILFTGGVILSNIIIGCGVALIITVIFSISKVKHTNTHNELENGNNATHTQSDTMSASSHPAITGALYLKGFLWLLMGHTIYILTFTVSEFTIYKYGHAWDIKLEPLLVLMVASCIAGHNTSIRHEMHVILDSCAPFVFLPFFVMTGAGLKLDQVIQVIPLMSVYVIVRFIGIFIASYLAGRFLLKLEPRQYNALWLTMTPQAGVALGLANEINNLSTDPWASEFAATIVAAVVVNQIIGPVLCSMGMVKAGEANVLGKNLSNESNDIDDRFSEIRLEQKSSRTHRSSSLVSKHKTTEDSPLFRAQNAIVFGCDELAFEISLQMYISGAQVTLPLLDEQQAERWQHLQQGLESLRSETLALRTAVESTGKVDVMVFTGDPKHIIERVQCTQANSPANLPRMIAIVPDSSFTQKLRAMNVLTIQPSIALANTATRMALLGGSQAQILSGEVSTTSQFSTAMYFMQENHRMEAGYLTGMHFRDRQLHFQNVSTRAVPYDTIGHIFERRRPAPQTSRYSMFGTVEASPFTRPRQVSAYEYYVAPGHPEAPISPPLPSPSEDYHAHEEGDMEYTAHIGHTGRGASIPRHSSRSSHVSDHIVL